MINYISDRDGKDYQAMWEKMLKAVDSGDGNELVSLFSKTAIKDNPDFRTQLDAFFQVYKGPMEISDTKPQSGGSSEKIEYGKRETELSGGSGENTFLIADGIRYHIYMKICSHDDFDKDNEGILRLEIVTDEARNSKYFAWHYSQLGFYYQDSTEKRDDIMWIEGRSWDYKHIDRTLTADKLVEAVEMNDDFDAFTARIGEPNCSWEIYGTYYYELENGLFAVCQLSMDTRYDPDQKSYFKRNSIIAIYLADEEDNLQTIWMADDIIKVCGTYSYYTPVTNRELTEKMFVDFIGQSDDFSLLVKEIGPPDVNRDLSAKDCFYQISENRFVSCDVRDGKDGKVIADMYVVDSESRLYKLH